MCPECREPMIVFELDGIEIDRCVVCGGTWLDAGELERITRHAGVPSGELLAAIQRAESGERVPPGTRRCPRCRRRLTPVTIAGAETIDLDCCMRGHGLWFDRGEIRALIDSFGGRIARGAASGEGEAAARFFFELYRNDLTPGPD